MFANAGHGSPRCSARLLRAAALHRHQVRRCPASFRPIRLQYLSSCLAFPWLYPLTIFLGIDREPTVWSFITSPPSLERPIGSGGAPHAKIKCGQNHATLAWQLNILVVAGKSRRNGMAPAFAMVFLSQEPSTKNGIIRPAIVVLAWILLLPARTHANTESATIAGVDGFDSICTLEVGAFNLSSRTKCPTKRVPSYQKL